MLRRELLEKLCVITPEEQEFLSGKKDIDRERYGEPAGDELVIDTRKLLDTGKLMQIRPHTRFVHFPRHKHNYVELIYMCSGSTTHIINSKKVQLSEGELLFLSQSAVQEILPAGKDDIAVNFIILPEFFDLPLQMLGSTDNLLSEFIIDCLRKKDSSVGYLHFRVSDVPMIQNLVENLILGTMDDSRTTRSISKVTMGLLFIQLLQYTDRVNVNKQSPQDHIRLVTLRYIETHYRNGTLEELAFQLGYDVCTMSRMIKKISGRSFTELLQTKRLSQACWLLENTNLSVEEVSLRVGYENKSYFTRIFKDKFEMTPGEYRKK